MNLTTELNTAAVFAAFASPVVLIAVYTLAAPWWRSPVGRALVQMVCGIVLAMLPPALHRITGSATSPVTPFYTWVQTAAWLFLAAMVLRLTWLSYRINKKGRRDG